MVSFTGVLPWRNDLVPPDSQALGLFDRPTGSRRGDELPEELKRREDRLEKIREAKARLETEARALV